MGARWAGVDEGTEASSMERRSDFAEVGLETAVIGEGGDFAEVRQATAAIGERDDSAEVRQDFGLREGAARARRQERSRRQEKSVPDRGCAGGRPSRRGAHEGGGWAGQCGSMKESRGARRSGAGFARRGGCGSAPAPAAPAYFTIWVHHLAAWIMTMPPLHTAGSGPWALNR